jgi:hypothetical protein
MEQGKAAGLNGWQRLWIAIALISIVPAVAMIRSEWESADVWVRDLQQMPTHRVAIEGAGEVEFPATMSAEAIALVTRGGAGNAQAIRAGISAWDAEFNNVIRACVSDLNRSLVIQAAALWAGGVALLYAAGWLFAWVRRGFRT